jgi:predicted glutamine amidotransferase
MCGHVGIMGALVEKDFQVLHWLLHLDTIRGTHSTGVAAIHPDGDGVSTKLYKAVGAPHRLYGKHAEHFPGGVYKAQDAICMIGHNRYATQGEVNEENAHPFEFDKVIGAHNGTVPAWSLRNLSNSILHHIDSKAIFQHISDTDNLQSLWDEADGAMALVWWDKVRLTLNFLRNKERTLHYTVANNGKLYWASEKWMLEVVLDRFNIIYQKIKLFDVDVHYVADLTKAGVVITQHKLKPPTRRWVSQGNFQHTAGGSGTTNLFSKPDYNEVMMIKIVEYVHSGPEEWAGEFFAKDEFGKEVRISIKGPNNEKLYHSIMTNIDAKRPYYNVPKRSLYAMYGMQNVHGSVLTHYSVMVKANWPWEVVIPTVIKALHGGDMLKTSDSLLGKTEFEAIYHDGCSLCGQAVKWEDAKDALFLPADNMICKDCKDEPLVQDYINELRTGT